MACRQENIKERVREADLKRSLGLRVVVVVVVTLALLCDFLLLTVIIPILPTALMGTDDSLIFLLFASKAAVQILANAPIGMLVDKVGPKIPLLCASVGLMLSTAVFVVGLTLPALQADDSTSRAIRYSVLLAARASQGVASAATMSGGMTLVALSTPEEQRGKAMGFATAGIALGVLVGPVFGGVVAGVFETDWLPFFLIGAAVLADFAALLALFVVGAERLRSLHALVAGERAGGGGDTPAIDAAALSAAPVVGGASVAATSSGALRDAAQRESTLRITELSDTAVAAREDENPFAESGEAAAARADAARAPSIYCSARALITGGAIFVANCAVAVIEPLIPLYLAQNFDWAKGKPLYQGLTFAVATVCYLLSTVVAGLVSDCASVRPRKHLLLLVGLVAQAAGLSIVVLPLESPSIWTVVIGLALIGSAMGLIDTPAQPILADIATALHASRRSGGGGAAARGGPRASGASLVAPLLDDVAGRSDDAASSDASALDYVEANEDGEEEGAQSGAFGSAFALYDTSTSLGFVCGPLLAAGFGALHIEGVVGGARYKFFALVAPLAALIALYAPLTLCIGRRRR
jgi:MFS family permease